jgi:ElaB/YqjD/DUF883 family membrane-anchored ribosome-binding protein
MKEFFSTYLLPFLATVITGIISYIGMQIKKAYTNYVNTRTIKEIVEDTVLYVEQVNKNKGITSDEKFNEAKEKASSWLASKNITISDTELEILIESVVKKIDN